ncbi:MAG: hypothetical protein WB772_08965, partial [Xanthobacteraceae bacterium]
MPIRNRAARRDKQRIVCRWFGRGRLYPQPVVRALTRKGNARRSSFGLLDRLFSGQDGDLLLIKQDFPPRHR